MRSSSCLVLASLPVLLLVAHAGLAQEQSSSASSNGDLGSSTELKEVIVTAERRKENVLTVPAAVQALTATQLRENHIQTLTDLQFTTPGLLPNTGQGFTQLFIRGIGNNIFAGADPSVATFVDGVPRIYGSLDQNLVDVDRVEILKGAQGGLYGRNATGGVVNIITRQPSTTEPFSGDSLLDYGEMGTFRAAAWANVPVSDRVAFLLSVQRDSHGPYVKNLAPPAPYTAAMFPTGSPFGTPQETAALLNAHVHPAPGLDNENYWATDDKMLLQPSDTLRITFAGDYSAKVDSDGSANVDTTPGYVQSYLSADVLTPFGFNPDLPPGVERGASGSFTTALGDPNYVDTWDYGGSATAVWEAPSVEVTSISAYRGQTTNFLAGGSAGTVPDIDEEVDAHRDFAYQELRAQSTYGGRFSWITGATYLTSHISNHTGVALLGGLAPAADIRSKDTVKNWSIYAQLAYEITPRLSLTVSDRYEHEFNVTDYSLPTVASARTGESKSIPSATLSYKLDDDGNVYVRWARGVKAGGINPTVAPIYFPNGAPGEIFAPEQVDTYEAGYRRALFDRKVQLTADVFYNDYRDVQFTDHANAAYASTVLLAIMNARSARTYGAEETLAWRVSTPVTVGVNLGYLDAKYDNAALENNPVLASFDFSGKTMLNSPRWQGSFTGNLEEPVTERLDFVADALVSYVSRVIYGYSAVPGILPDDIGPPYWLTNASVGVQTSDGKYSLRVYGKNLFNRAYYTSGNVATTGDFLVWGNPRVIGAEISARF